MARRLTPLSPRESTTAPSATLVAARPRPAPCKGCMALLSVRAAAATMAKAQAAATNSAAPPQATSDGPAGRWPPASASSTPAQAKAIAVAAPISGRRQFHSESPTATSTAGPATVTATVTVTPTTSKAAKSETWKTAPATPKAKSRGNGTFRRAGHGTPITAAAANRQIAPSAVRVNPTSTGSSAGCPVIKRLATPVVPHRPPARQARRSAFIQCELQIVAGLTEGAASSEKSGTRHALPMVNRPHLPKVVRDNEGPQSRL